MDSVHHIWCPLSSQEFQDLPDGAETTLTIIASSGQAIFQGKQQNYVMLTGLSINFHLHYLDALKKNLIAI
ncbi:two-component sensor histidine kinase, partial [Klebsiella pneumoniae]